MISQLEFAEILEVLRLHYLMGYLSTKFHESPPFQDSSYLKLRIVNEDRPGTVAVLEISHSGFLENPNLSYVLSYSSAEETQLVETLAKQLSALKTVKVEIKKITPEELFHLS